MPRDKTMIAHLTATRDRASADIKLFTQFNGSLGIADWASERERMLNHLNAIIESCDALIVKVKLENVTEAGN